MAHEVDEDSVGKAELDVENGRPVNDSDGPQGCPVCGDEYVHATRPPQNKSSVSGMHVCYSVDSGELVMYIHGERQSTMMDEDAPLCGASDLPSPDEFDNALEGDDE